MNKNIFKFLLSASLSIYLSSNAAKEITNSNYNEDGSIQYEVSLLVENKDLFFKGGLESNGYHRFESNIQEVFFQQDGEYPFDGFYALIPNEQGEDKSGGLYILNFDNMHYIKMKKFGTGNLDNLIRFDDYYIFQAEQSLYFAKKGEINFFEFKDMPGFYTGMTVDHLVMDARFDFNKLWVTICDIHLEEFRILSFNKSFIDNMVAAAYSRK